MSSPVLSLAAALGLAVLPAAASAEGPTTPTLTIELTSGSASDLGVFWDRLGPAIPDDTLAVSGTLTEDLAGPVAGAVVQLQRRVRTGPGFVGVAQRRTGADGSYLFNQHVVGSSRYRVVYAGDGAHAAATATTGAWSQDASVPWTLPAMRDLNAHKREVGGALYLRGNINPGWSGRPIALTRKTCRSCGWRTVATKRTGRGGTWSFRVAYPRRVGPVWVYQAVIRGEGRFVRSYSAQLTTQRVYARQR